MAKGDAFQVVIDMGGGMSREWVIRANKDGRRLEVTRSRTEVVIRELTRGGKQVRESVFMTARLLALVEKPAGEPDDVAPRRRRRGQDEAAPGQMDMTQLPAAPA